MAKENDAVILSAARTPIGRFQGSLSNVPAAQLGAIAVKAAVERAGINPAEIEEVIMGNVVQAGEGQAPARQSGILGGIPATLQRSRTLWSSSFTEMTTTYRIMNILAFIPR